MPVNYHCKSCELEIILGPYHGVVLAEYSGGLYVACRACGTQFHVAFASRDRGPEYFEYFDAVLTSAPESGRVPVMRMLRADLGLSIADTVEMLEHLPALVFRRLPLESALGRQSSYASVGALLTIENVQREPNTQFGPIAADRFQRYARPRSVGDPPGDWIEVPISGRRDSPGGGVDLHQQPCTECKAIGSFLSDMQAPPAACPRCKKPDMEYASGWVT